MGIRVNGPQVVSFLEWLSTHAENESSLQGIGEEALLRYARAFRRELTIENYNFDERDILTAIEREPPRSWRNLFSSKSWRNILVKRRPLYDGDLLERYKNIPFHSLLLYTSQDGDLRKYLSGQWQAWSDESGDLLDFYDYSIQTDSPKAYSFTKDFLNTLSIIPGARAEEIYATGLPCMLVWSTTDYYLVPFSDVANDAKAIRDRFRYVLRCLSERSLDELKYRRARRFSSFVQ